MTSGRENPLYAQVDDSEVLYAQVDEVLYAQVDEVPLYAQVDEVSKSKATGKINILKLLHTSIL